MMRTFPVLVFGYNRPIHLRRTCEALAENGLAEETSVYIFLDGAKRDQELRDVEACRRVARGVQGFRDVTIIESNENQGLANSIICGVSSIVDEHDAVIVLEDDLVTSPHFLSYMNSALKKYRDSSRVMSVSAYGRPEIRKRLSHPDCYDAYFAPRNSSWGWGTWRRAWRRADWRVPDYAQFRRNRNRMRRFARGGNDLCLMLDLQQHGLLDSWAIRWTYAHFLHDAVSLVPYNSYVKNIGLDGSGTHCRKSARLGVDLDMAVPNPRLPQEVRTRDDALAAFREAHRLHVPGQVYWRTRLMLRRLRIR